MHCKDGAQITQLNGQVMESAINPLPHFAAVLIAIAVAASLASPARAAESGTIQSLASGKCLDLEGGNTADGPVVIQYDCHSGPNQQWSIQPAGGAGYRIVSKLSGKCIGIDRTDSGTSAPILQSPCGGGATEQLWSLVSAGGGYVVKAIASGRCLDIPGASSVNGARPVAWKCNRGENQVWRLPR
jgi:hypothetical protein